jgi:hypothetical protein
LHIFFFPGVSVASSIFTITAMAVDRYLAITRPFGFFYRCFNKRTTTIIILLMWILSLALFMPVLLVTGTSQLEYIEVQNKSLYINVHFCGEHWEKSSMSPVQQALGITWFIFMFVLPGKKEKDPDFYIVMIFGRQQTR